MRNSKKQSAKRDHGLKTKRQPSSLGNSREPNLPSGLVPIGDTPKDNEFDPLALHLRKVIELGDLQEAGSVEHLAGVRGVKENAIYERIEALTKSFGGLTLVNKQHKNQRGRRLLSPAAEQLLKAAEVFQAAALQAYRRANLDSGHDAPDIRIAAPQALAIHFFPTWLAEYHASRFPSLRISIAAANVMDCLSHFEQGQADFLLWWKHSSLKAPVLVDFESVPLATDYLVPVCRHKDDDTESSDLEAVLSQLASDTRLQLPVLNYAQGTSLRGAVEHIVSRCGLKERVHYGHQADSAGALKQMVRHGLGIAWIPNHTVAGSKSITRIDEAMRKREIQRPGAFKIKPNQMSIPLTISLIRRARAQHAGPQRSGPRRAFWANARKLAEKTQDFSTSDS